MGIDSRDRQGAASPTTAVVAPETVGEGLRLLQSRAGMLRDDLARAAGISSGSLSNYLNDVSIPPAGVLRTLSDILSEQLGLNPARVWGEFGKLLAPRHRLPSGNGWPHPSTELVRTVFHALAEDDIETFAQLHADDVVVHVPGRNLFAGEHQGEVKLLELVEAARGAVHADVQFENHDVLANDRHAVLIQAVKLERDGRTLNSERVVVCHVVQGRVSEMWVYPYDQYALDEFWGRG